MALLLTAV